MLSWRTKIGERCHRYRCHTHLARAIPQAMLISRLRVTRRLSVQSKARERKLQYSSRWHGTARITVTAKKLALRS